MRAQSEYETLYILAGITDTTHQGAILGNQQSVLGWLLPR